MIWIYKQLVISCIKINMESILEKIVTINDHLMQLAPFLSMSDLLVLRFVNRNFNIIFSDDYVWSGHYQTQKQRHGINNFHYVSHLEYIKQRYSLNNFGTISSLRCSELYFLSLPPNLTMPSYNSTKLNGGITTMTNLVSSFNAGCEEEYTVDSLYSVGIFGSNEIIMYKLVYGVNMLDQSYIEPWRKGEVVAKLPHVHNDMVWDTFHMGNNSFIACSFDGTVSHIDYGASSMQLKNHSPVIHYDRILAGCKLNDFTLLTGSRDRSVKCVDMRTNSISGTIHTTSCVYSLGMLSNEYHALVGCHNGDVSVYDIRRMQLDEDSSKPIAVVSKPSLGAIQKMVVYDQRNKSDFIAVGTRSGTLATISCHGEQQSEDNILGLKLTEVRRGGYGRGIRSILAYAEGTRLLSTDNAGYVTVHDSSKKDSIYIENVLSSNKVSTKQVTSVVGTPDTVLVYATMDTENNIIIDSHSM